MARKKLKQFPYHDEKKIVESAIIFYNRSLVETQKSFYYDQTNKRKKYVVDCLVEKRKVIIEYDGPVHYNNIWKIKRDQKRYRYFKDLGYRVIPFPYYCALTRDMAKYLFGKKYYSDNKYNQMLKQVCKVNVESEILGPGWHTSKKTPANFHKLGIDRFCEELDVLPDSQKDGIIYSLQLYINDESPELIVPEDSRINELLDLKVDDKHLQYYYYRRDGKIYE